MCVKLVALSACIQLQVVSDSLPRYTSLEIDLETEDSFYMYTTEIIFLTKVLWLKTNSNDLLLMRTFQKELSV